MLIEQLFAKQKELWASDPEFARLLGVSYATWNQTRKGQRRIGLKLIAAAAATFPDLEETATQALKQRAKNETTILKA
jgi:transcriptional regulator with XRE-family HTH domain